MMDSSVPSEPPDITIPPEPTVVARDNLPPSVPHDDPNVIPQDVPDDVSYGTYDYTTILPPHHHTNTSVPGRVHVPPCLTADTTVTTERHNATPFLTAGSEKTLPKYSGNPRMIFTNSFLNFVHFLNTLLSIITIWMLPLQKTILINLNT